MDGRIASAIGRIEEIPSHLREIPFPFQKPWLKSRPAGVMSWRASWASRTAAAVQEVLSSGQITPSGKVTPIQ